MRRVQDRTMRTESGEWHVAETGDKSKAGSSGASSASDSVSQPRADVTLKSADSASGSGAAGSQSQDGSSAQGASGAQGGDTAGSSAQGSSGAQGGDTAGSSVQGASDAQGGDTAGSSAQGPSGEKTGGTAGAQEQFVGQTLNADGTVTQYTRTSTGATARVLTPSNDSSGYTNTITVHSFKPVDVTLSQRADKAPPANRPTVAATPRGESVKSEPAAATSTDTPSSAAADNSTHASVDAASRGTDQSGQSDTSGDASSSARTRDGAGDNAASKAAGNPSGRSDVTASAKADSATKDSAAQTGADGKAGAASSEQNTAQAGSDTKLTDDEAWSAAQDGAKDWAKDRAVRAVVDAAVGPVWAPIVHLVQDALKEPEKPPASERERQIRENHDAMQRTLDVAAFGVGVAVGGIAGTVGEMRSAKQAATGLRAAQAGLTEGAAVAGEAKATRAVDRKPRGFTTDRAKPGRNLKPGTMEGLEPPAHDSVAQPRNRSVTRSDQLEGIGRAPRASPDAFMNDALANASDPDHPLHSLVKPGSKPGTFEWRTVTRVTKKGNVQTGRYHSGEVEPIVQAGHGESYAAEGPQRFALEDADMNIASGEQIESRGGFSAKERVFVTKADGTKGVWVEAETLKHYERMEGPVAGKTVVPEGTFQRASATTPRETPPSMEPQVRVAQTAQEYLAEAKRPSPAAETGQGPRIDVGVPADEPAAPAPEKKKQMRQR
jgi:hypothetical protein